MRTMVGKHATRHRRRTLGAAVALVWLLAIELLPNLHLAFHRADHTHAAGGQIVATVRVDLGGHGHGHDHAAGTADHAHDLDADPPPARRRGPTQLAIDEAVPVHAALGTAHRQVAIQDPPPPTLAPAVVLRASPWVIAAPNPRPVATYAARPHARGPPGAG